MSRQQEQVSEGDFKEARKHLHRSWRQWLHGKDGSSSADQQQAKAAAQAAAQAAPGVIAFNRFGPLQNQVDLSCLHDIPSCHTCFQSNKPSPCDSKIWQRFLLSTDIARH